MPYQHVTFHQTGSLAAGGRLLAEDQRPVQSDRRRPDSLTLGHRACQGCGEALGARYALDAVQRATGGQTIAVNATGCLEMFSTPFPETSWQLPWLHSLFGNAPAVAAGVAAALKAKGRTGVRVVGQGARLATRSGLFPVFEAEDGEVVSVTPIRHQVGVRDYLRTQRRYAHLFRPEKRTGTIDRIQRGADRNIARFGLLGTDSDTEQLRVEDPAHPGAVREIEREQS